MRTRPFGPVGLVPVIGQGSWQSEQDGEAAVRALRTGLDLGMTHIDTAEMYGDGEAERLVARAIEGRREQVFLVSKVHPRNASLDGTVAACEASLRRLETDWLDCYLLHWRGEHPLEQTFRAFDRLLQQGKIRSFGVSNFDVPDLEQAAGLVGADRIACNQVLYHLEDRYIEREVEPWCAARRVAVVAYSPFGGGGSFPSNHPALTEIARGHGATPQQVALAFLTRRDHVFAIPKASGAQHVRDNAAAAALSLSADDVAALDRAFPARPGDELPTR